MKNLGLFIILVSLIGCSADKDKNYGSTLQKRQARLQSQSSQSSEAPGEQAQEVEDRTRECTPHFKTSLDEILEIKESSPFEFEIKVNDYLNRTKAHTAEAHNFLQLNQALDRCMGHSNAYTLDPFSCIDQDQIPIDFSIVENFCKSLVEKNETDEKFQVMRKLYNDKDDDFLAYLYFNDRMKKKYTKDGTHLRDVKKIKVDVVHEDLSQFVNKNTKKGFSFEFFMNPLKVLTDINVDRRIVDGKVYYYLLKNEDSEHIWKHLNKETDSIQKFLYINKNVKPQIHQDTALVVCSLSYQETHKLQLIRNFDSFETESLLVLERNSGIVTALKDSASQVSIKAPLTYFEKSSRAYNIECRSQVPELLTIENLNKTLENFISLEVLEYKNQDI